MSNIKTLINTKKFIYFIRLIGWIDLPIAIYIGLFHKEVFGKYPVLTLFFILIFFLTDYKVNYRDMKVSKRIVILLLYFVACIFCAYVVYFIGRNF
ncbi:hypothetical protein SDC9_57010 [bioreactor metagenome]|jgi:hypothetical protein|uniref:Uncharacterized protein n=1 Tax=bioreactor metagenome TaxID=1076179 RepID=A0A644X3H0_9ZZZZ